MSQFILRFGFVVGTILPYILYLVAGEMPQVSYWVLCIHLMVISIGGIIAFEDKR